MATKRSSLKRISNYPVPVLVNKQVITLSKRLAVWEPLTLIKNQLMVMRREGLGLTSSRFGMLRCKTPSW